MLPAAAGNVSDVPTAGTRTSSNLTEFSTSVEYMAPGEYMLSVASSSAANSTLVTVQSEPRLLALHCPPLVQPAESYYCTATVGGAALAITAAFDGSPPVTVTPPETPWQGVGRPPPRGPARPPVQLTAGQPEFVLRQPFTRRTRLMALHWHGAGAGDCQLKVT